MGMGPQGGKLSLNTSKMAKILLKCTYVKLKWKILNYEITQVVGGANGTLSAI